VHEWNQPLSCVEPNFLQDYPVCNYGSKKKLKIAGRCTGGKKPYSKSQNGTEPEIKYRRCWAVVYLITFPMIPEKCIHIPARTT
jgi:hypothetical protein